MCHYWSHLVRFIILLGNFWIYFLFYYSFVIFCFFKWILEFHFSSAQSFRRVRLFATPWITARQASLSITNSRSSLRLTSIQSVMPSSHLILCHPLLLLPPIPPSIRVFSNESTLRMRWPKYWSFSFSIIPFKEIPGLIFFRMDWLDLLAVQGTLKSLLEHHSSKASILQCSAFFTVQLSHPYMTTGKTVALTRWTFVGKVMSLLFNMLSRLVITFLPRSKRLLISWLQSPSAVILEPKKIKSDTVSTVPLTVPCICLGSPVRVKVFFKKLANTDDCLVTVGARHRCLVEVSSGHTCQWFLLCGQNSAWIMGMEATLCQSSEHPKSATWKTSSFDFQKKHHLGLLLGHWKQEKQLFIWALRPTIYNV